jgi:hypothetical protein
MPIRLGTKKLRLSFVPKVLSNLTRTNSPIGDADSITSTESTHLVPSPCATPKTSNPSHTHPAFSPGELGKLATQAAMDLKRFGWHKFIASRRRYSSVNTPAY